MFANIPEDYIIKIKADALDALTKLDEEYLACQDLVEQFCKTNKILISSVRALIGQPRKRAEVVSVYAPNPFPVARDLSHFLLGVLRNFIYLKTVLKNEELFIEYRCRKVAEIFTLQKYASIDFFTMMQPVDMNGLLYLPVPIELMELYHKLYLPEKFDEWEELFNIESQLFDKWKVESKLPSAKSESRYRPFVTPSHRHIAIIKSIIADFAKTNNCVLVGHWAMSDIMQLPTEKIQLISSSSIEMDMQNIGICLAQTIKPPPNITVREQKLHITKDFRIRRFTIYLVGNDGKQIPIADIFNNASFELVPYTITKRHIVIKDRNRDALLFDGEFRIGTSPVLLRFLLIDLWTLRLIRKLGKIDQSLYNYRSLELMRFVASVRHKLTKKDILNKEYIGIYKDYVVEKRIYNYQNKQNIRPYVPSYESLHSSASSASSASDSSASDSSASSSSTSSSESSPEVASSL